MNLIKLNSYICGYNDIRKRRMFRSFEKISKEKAERDKIAQLPANRRLKYIAWAFGICVIILLLLMIIWLDTFSVNVFLVLRGCTGLCAILFMIFVAIYLYRIHYIYFKQKSDRKN